jgi:large subunit ribosomal protein L19e
VAKTAKATTKSAVKTVKTTANATAKSATKAASNAKTAGKAIIADVKKDIDLATKPNSTWSVADLKAAARKKGIPGYSSMTKPQLLKALGAK